MASHFRELEVWQTAMTLAKAVYSLVADFPREERYGLSSQLQRAAVSVPSNIAEGNVRATTRDYARFVSQACGSAAELQTQLMLAASLELGDHAKIEQALDMCERVSKMLRRLHQALSAKLDPGSPIPGPRSRS
ncbi:MAG: four helix bundle protein [Proteobacteria bacterium]|nr:four helix bundle protein [Pseudomonadota bacterium]MBS0230254.1 four helix bundle protein [Pseudomonadota bacterium]